MPSKTRLMSIAAALCAVMPSLLSAAELPPAVRDDVQLRAMLDELARSKTLQLSNLDKPYFIGYTSNDAEEAAITGSLGGIVSSARTRVRVPVIQVRVGNYSFDNTNSVFTAPVHFGPLPLDNNYGAIRTALWLDTDGTYKVSTEQIARKRNTLRELATPENTPDFAPVKPATIVQPVPSLQFDDKQWEAVIRNVSARFAAHPAVVSSNVRVRAISSTLRLVTSEGTVVRVPQELSSVDIVAAGIAPDNSRVWNHRLITVVHPSELPKEEDLRKEADAVASETDALVKAPAAEDYSGPVLFEGEAAPGLVAQLLTDATRLARKPVTPTEFQSRVQTIDGVWSSRVGSKVTPEWLTIVDDPSQKTFGGKTLAGQYDVDEEGVPAQRVTLVDKGVFKGFLLTRQPVRNWNASNGHARLPGPWGANLPVFGNLFIQAGQTVPESQMKAKLIDRVKSAGLKYGLLIRRMDFPSTAGLEDLQEMVAQLQKSGSTRSVTAPLLAYRVYPDGREELVRGLRFKEFSAKDLRDVDAASDHPYVLNYVNNGGTFDWANATSDATTSSVICPSLLFDSVDLAHAEGQGNKPPIVPAPLLVARH